ncbi:MAG TPA: DUF1843 domain-containing protein [Pyrinomonadaceae bacterium]|nr:DUF1843 domain-containing protein [Pyrinomonadaceae bacterium]
MPTRKQSAGASKSAGARKSSPDLMSRAAAGPIPPYGVAIREAIARGDQAEMKRVAAQARKHVADVQKALERLEKKMG